MNTSTQELKEYLNGTGDSRYHSRSFDRIKVNKSEIHMYIL